MTFCRVYLDETATTADQARWDQSDLRAKMGDQESREREVCGVPLGSRVSPAQEDCRVSRESPGQAVLLENGENRAPRAKTETLVRRDPRVNLELEASEDPPDPGENKDFQ